MTTKADKDELDQFLKRVEQVKEAVDGLVKGDLQPEHTDGLLRSLRGEVEPATKLPETKREEDRLKGRPGKGAGDGYNWFCRFCHREFLAPETIECDVCHSAHGKLMTFDERKAELKAKVAEAMRLKDERKERRERAKKLTEKRKKAQAAHRARHGTDYEAWDIYEPDSDEEDAPFVPPDDPAFKAMERDILQRKERRKQAEFDAGRHKELGNEAFARKDWARAVELYGQAIELHRSEKSFYTNRAAAYLQLGKFKDAIKDCNTVLEIWEFLEDKARKHGNQLVFKAFLRRAAGHRGLQNFAAAITDLEQALEVMPGDKEAAKLLGQTRADMEERRKAADVLQQAGLPVSSAVVVADQPEQSDANAKATKAGSDKRNGKPAAAEASSETSLVKASPGDSKLSLTSSATATQAVDASLAKEAGLLLEILKDVRAHLDSASSAQSHSASANGTVSKSPSSTVLKSALKDLRQLLRNNKHRILLREQGGLEVLQKLVTAAPDLSLFALSSLTEAANNDHNKDALVKAKCVDLLTQLLSAQYSLNTEPAFKLLASLSEHPAARQTLVKEAKSTTDMLTKWMLDKRASIQSVAASCFCNVAYEARYKQHLRSLDPPAAAYPLVQLAPSAIALLLSADSKRSSDAPTTHTLTAADANVSADVQSSALGALGNLLTDKELRESFIRRPLFLSLTAQLLSRECARLRNYSSEQQTALDEDATAVLAKLLAVCMNCAVEAPAHATLFGGDARFIGELVGLVKNSALPELVRKRAMGLLSRAAKNTSFTEGVIAAGGITAMLELIANALHPASASSHSSPSSSSNAVAAAADGKSSETSLSLTAVLNERAPEADTIDHAVRGVAACVLASKAAVAQIRDFRYAATGISGARSGFNLLVELLSHKASMVRGNAALCVSNCVGHDTSLAAEFRDAVVPLVEIMKDPNDTAQQNAAVAAARLAKDPTNLARLRDLRALEMMLPLAAKVRQQT